MNTITGNQVRFSYAYSGNRVHSIEQACASVPFTIIPDQICRIGTNVPIRGEMGLFRSDTGGNLGIHSPKYSFIQPCDSLATLERARELIGGKWASVSLPYEGRQLLAFIELEQTVTAPKRGDKVGFAIALRDHFDGSGKCTLELLEITLACNNGNVRRDSLVTFSAKHSGGVKERFALMEKQLHTNLILAIGETQELVTSLDSKPMSRGQVQDFAERLFPAAADGSVSTQAQNKREEIIAGFSRGTGNVGRTAWDAFNSVTEFLDWGATYRETEFSRAENRMNSLLAGPAAQVRNRAIELLMQF